MRKFRDSFLSTLLTIGVMSMQVAASAQNIQTQPATQNTDPLVQQNAQTQQALDAATATAQDAKADAEQAKADAAAAKDAAEALTKALAAIDKHPEFELSLGIGTLVNAATATDYTNQSNTLQATNLGRSTPQYLVGVSFRTPFPNFIHFMRSPGHYPKTDCLPDDTKPMPARIPAPSDRKAPKDEEVNPRHRTPEKISDDSRCSYWSLKPWKGFVSLKFASGTSQTLSGFVIGGSYQFGHWIDGLVGFGFTPFNEASPGFRVAASNFVAAQQKLGNDLNYNPAAMLAGEKNAFDGFPLTDSAGTLIYKGSPLETHFRGGIVLGISIPFDFGKSFLNK